MKISVEINFLFHCLYKVTIFSLGILFRNFMVGYKFLGVGKKKLLTNAIQRQTTANSKGPFVFILITLPVRETKKAHRLEEQIAGVT